MSCKVTSLVFTLALALLVAPLATEAQPARKVPRIGVVAPLGPPPAANPDIDGFRQGLRELGYVEGQTITVEYRWASTQLDRYRALAVELARLPVDVLVVTGTAALPAVRQVSSMVPIVMGSKPMSSASRWAAGTPPTSPSSTRRW